MKVLLINEVCGHTSTGKICAQTAERMEADGHKVKIAYGRSGYVPQQYKKYGVRIGSGWDVRFHALQTRLFDTHGFGSRKATRKFLKLADDYDPDLIWLHNLHGYYIHIELLFQWIKSHPEKEVRWTLHDCWAFTGHCTHFSALGCDRWKYGCYDCPQKKYYPASFGKDNSRDNYERKKRAFTGVSNLTLITPSEWMRNIVQKSFLGGYAAEVMYNTADTSIFKPQPGSIRRKYGIGRRTMILGVANVWTDRKGFQDFLQLSGVLDDESVIVLVGLGKQQMRMLPANVIGIEKIKDQRQLASIYSAADFFFNPSREESFGMTTLEAVLCGTYAIVYKGTACEEVIQLYQGSGISILPGDIRKVKQIIETDHRNRN